MTSRRRTQRAVTVARASNTFCPRTFSGRSATNRPTDPSVAINSAKTHMAPLEGSRQLLHGVFQEAEAAMHSRSNPENAGRLTTSPRGGVRCRRRSRGRMWRRWSAMPHASHASPSEGGAAPPRGRVGGRPATGGRPPHRRTGRPAVSHASDHPAKSVGQATLPRPAVSKTGACADWMPRAGGITPLCGMVVVGRDLCYNDAWR